MEPPGLDGVDVSMESVLSFDSDHPRIRENLDVVMQPARGESYTVMPNTLFRLNAAEAVEPRFRETLLQQRRGDGVKGIDLLNAVGNEEDNADLVFPASLHEDITARRTEPRDFQ
jgi:hypothetical protein